MKQFILVFVLSAFAFSQASYAQGGLELTATFTPGFSTILNQEDLARTNIDEHQTSLGLEAKVTVGHNFTNHIGIATGLGVTFLEQNYIKPTTKNLIKLLHHTTDRQFSYLRIPALLRIGSNPYAANSFFMRMGPHLDILTMAVSNTQFPFDTQQPNERINYYKPVNYRGQQAAIFNSFVVGFSIEMGIKIGLTDQLGLLLLGHFESTLSNVDGTAAPLYFPSTTTTVKRYWGDLEIEQRSHTFNLMGGLSIGVHYVLNPAGYNMGSYRRPKRYKMHRWN